MVLLEAEVALQRAGLGGFFQGGVDLFFSGLFFYPDDEVDDRDVGRGHAHGEAIEFAGQIGDDELNGLGGARRGRNHVERGGAGAPQIFVREVEDHLIVRIRVDGGHGAADDLEVVVDDLGDRGQTIRGAGRVRDDVVLGGIVLFFVHAENDGEILVLAGGGDDDFFHGAAQMLLRFVGVGELSGGFDDHLRSDGVPGQGSGIFFFEDFDGLAVDRNTVGAGGDFVRQVAKNRIVFEQVGQSFGIGEIVHGYEVEVLVSERGAKNVASDASKSINANFYGHGASERDFVCLRKHPVACNKL